MVARLSHMTTSPGRHVCRYVNSGRVASKISSRQQRPGLVLTHALDGIGMRGDVERGPVVDGVAPGHAPANRRDRHALCRGHQAGIDLIAGVGVGVGDDGVAQSRLNRRREPAPGMACRGELGFPAVVGNDACRQHRRQRRCRFERAIGMPKLIGAGGQCLLVGFRHQCAVCRDIVETAVERTGADGADLHALQRAEGAGKGRLHIVGDLLLAEQQHAVFLQGGTRRAIGSIAAGHVDQVDAPHFDAEIGAERNHFHDGTQIDACLHGY